MWSCWVDTLGLTAAPSPRLAAPLQSLTHTDTHTRVTHLLLPFSRCALRHGVFSSLPVLLYLTLIHANIAFFKCCIFFISAHCLVYLDFGLLWILCYEVYCDYYFYIKNKTAYINVLLLVSFFKIIINFIVYFYLFLIIIICILNLPRSCQGNTFSSSCL